MLDASLPLGWLSPSGFERLKTCPLLASYTRARPHSGAQSAASRLGDIAHRTLELYVKERPPVEAREAGLVDRWERAASELLPGETAWHDLPRAEVIRAKLSLVVGRLDDIIDGLPAGSSCVPECDLVAFSGRLRGRADLVIRGPVGMLIDYKTGVVRDLDGAVKASYERQLQLYAFMEYETTGSWPSRLVVATFTGPFLELPVDRAAGTALATDAMQRLADYESRVPGPQPARPSLEGCAWCPFAAECDAFWRIYSSDWQPQLVAARGVVEWIQRDGERVTFAIKGTAEHDITVIRGVRLDEFPQLMGLVTGSHVRVVGLKPDYGSNSFGPGPMPRFHVADA